MHLASYQPFRLWVAHLEELQQLQEEKSPQSSMNWHPDRLKGDAD